jgi:hypothetical protein
MSRVKELKIIAALLKLAKKHNCWGLKSPILRILIYAKKSLVNCEAPALIHSEVRDLGNFGIRKEK